MFVLPFNNALVMDTDRIDVIRVPLQLPDVAGDEWFVTVEAELWTFPITSVLKLDDGSPAFSVAAGLRCGWRLHFLAPFEILAAARN
jgi:hypothetical protein